MTDHHVLSNLMKFKNPSNWLAHWVMKLQEFSFQVIYKTGKLHINANTLSQHPQPLQEGQSTGDDAFLFSFLSQVDLANAKDDDINLRSLKNELHNTPWPLNTSALWCYVMC